jgi:deazaflavin-dependent oxidoreductase (nitroreductase family)
MSTTPTKRHTRRAVRVLLGAAALAALVTLPGIIVTRLNQQHHPWGPALMRRWNALTRTFAGKRFSPLAILEHTGRKSGKTFYTPLASFRLRDGFLLPLPYGPQVDWCRNTLATEHATLRRNGHAYPVERPELITLDAAVLADLPAPLRMSVKREAEQGLWLYRAHID